MNVAANDGRTSTPNYIKPIDGYKLQPKSRLVGVPTGVLCAGAGYKLSNSWEEQK